MSDSQTMVIADAPPRRCHSCQAENPDPAKFCWMCGVSLVARPAPRENGVVQANLVQLIEEQQREDPLALRLAPLLAVPLAAVVIWGLFTYDTFLGWIASPAILVATLVAVGHQFLVSGFAKPKSGVARAGVAGSSLMVGVIAGIGTFFATVVALVIVVIVFIVSVITAIAEFCGITAG